MPTMLPELEIRRLSRRDPCDRFDAGEGFEPLTRWFRQFAKQNDKRELIAVWVAVSKGNIAAFVSVVPGVIVAERLAGHVKHLPRPPAPVLLLARMATDVQSRGLGLGTHLVHHVFAQAGLLARDFGCVGVGVDAKPGAVKFYERCGFTALPAEPTGAPADGATPMFISLETARRLVAT